MTLCCEPAEAVVADIADEAHRWSVGFFVDGGPRCRRGGSVVPSVRSADTGFVEHGCARCSGPQSSAPRATT